MGETNKIEESHYNFADLITKSIFSHLVECNNFSRVLNIFDWYHTLRIIEKELSSQIDKKNFNNLLKSFSFTLLRLYGNYFYFANFSTIDVCWSFTGIW